METRTSILNDIQLKQKANLLRQHILSAIYAAKSGHPGPSLSAVEVVTLLYFGGILRYNPQEPNWAKRDRFILSKGHAAPLLYAALAEAGYFSTDLLPTLRKIDSPLEGHPDRRKLPGIEASTGSLGQGLSVGIGMSLAARLQQSSFNVFVLIGDGEIEEGQVWEAALFAGHHRLENLTAIVDCNKFQLDGRIAEILNLEPLQAKWAAFGWSAKVVDGHDFTDLREACLADSQGKPKAILANTIKGKGISFMENNNRFHGVAPNEEEFAKGMQELKEAADELACFTGGKS